jgi:hypothetical protein
MLEFFTLKSDDRYEITKCGIIRNKLNRRIKSQYVSSTGYYMISISKNNKTNPYKVHRLLADNFLEKVDGKTSINHKDGNKLNNCLSNLEWCNHLENMQHAFNTNLVNNTGSNNGMSKINESIALEIKTMLKNKISQQKIADKFNISRSLVLGINVGRLWKHVAL